MLFSTSRKMASIAWGSLGNGSSNNEAISFRLFAGVTRARSSPPYNRTTSSDAFRKSSLNVSKSESRLVPSAGVCLIISHDSMIALCVDRAHQLLDLSLSAFLLWEELPCQVTVLPTLMTIRSLAMTNGPLYSLCTASQ